MEQPNRLPAGGLINREETLRFQFDGQPYTGFQGDTLASALLAAGVRLMGRSFKYHRPRGLLTAGVEEPNALVELRTGAHREPNTRATQIELFDGLEAQSQNRWPSLSFDVGAVSSVFSPLLPAGFYYKTFMWPGWLWEKLYEPLIRRAAGLGRASDEEDPDAYEKVHAFCDVLVIGAGPAGLAAALAAGRSGARVMVCEEDYVLGGRLNADRREIDGRLGSVWVRDVESELVSLPEVRILRRTSVFGAYDGGAYGAVQRLADHRREPGSHGPRQRLWRIITRRAVLASGAVERPIVFGGNDRPGVMMASAARTYLNRFGVTPGRRVALFTCTDEAWTGAFDLDAAGIAVEGIIDARAAVNPALTERARRLGLRTHLASQVLATEGSRALRAVTVRGPSRRNTRLRADTLLISGGWNPNLALATHLGARPNWCESISAFVPGDLPPGMTVAGAARGAWKLADVLREGHSAGVEVAEASGFRGAVSAAPRADDELTDLTPLWFVPDSQGKAFVDFQNDVTRDDVALSVREGFRSAEHLKRYTTLGMGTDQGRTSSVNGLASLAALTERAIADVGTTTYRPPYAPIAIGTLGGTHRGKDFRPTRLTPAHRWAAEQGATFIEVGPWLRAQWFAVPGESNWLKTVAREAKAVRNGVGVCEVSTLGKIEVHGSDAATFLDRIYANLFSTLPVGKARYGLMLREDGFVMDDGTCARLAEHHYVMSTTTANAEKVLQHLDYALQVLWPCLDVQLVPVTEQWAQFSIAGPQSRNVLQRLFGQAIDLSSTTFPFLACAEFEWRGLYARLFRISFSGELAYELAVPARYADAVIRAIMTAGTRWNITPYGMEALNALRVEKGHAVISEINGTTTAADLGLGRMMSTKKDFIGRVLSQRAGLTAPDRPVLVGFKPVNRAEALNAGAHLLPLGAHASLENDQGYLTSVAFSPVLDHWIGLGLLSRGRERLGERVMAHDPVRSNSVEVEVVAPAFVDPEGARLQL